MNRSALFVDIRNSIYVQLLTTLVIYVQVPILIGLLNTEQYGIWATILSSVIVLGNLDLGISNTVKNEIAVHFVLGNYNEYYRVFQEGVIRHLKYSLLFLLSGTGILLLGYLTSEKYSIDLLLTIFFVLVGWSFDYVFKSVLLAYSAQQKNYAIQLSQFLINTFYLTLVLLLNENTSLLQFALFFSVIAPLINGSIFAHFIWKNCENLDKWTDISVNKFRGDLKFFHIQIGMFLLLNMGYILTLKLLGGSEVTGLNVVEKYFALTSLFANVVLFPLWSKFTQLYSNKEFSTIKLYFKRIERILLLLLFLIVIMIVVFDFVVDLWIGNALYIPIYLVLIVAAKHFFQIANSVYCYYLNAIGDLKLQVILYYSLGVLNVPISLLLFRFIGPEGVVLWPTLCMIFFALMSRRYVRKLL